MKTAVCLTALLFAMLTLSAPARAAGEEWGDAVPKGATAFTFGMRSLQAFQAVATTTAYDDKAGFGFTSTEGLINGGAAWPDSLTGNFVERADGQEFEFKAKLDNGQYLVWLAAGKAIRPEGGRHYLLQVGDQKVLDETVDDVRLSGKDYLGRFLLTPSPTRPERIWEAYVNVMHPGAVYAVKVADGVLSIKAANHSLAALVVLPADKKDDFDKMAQTFRDRRIAAFAKTVSAPSGQAKADGAGDYALWVPTDPERMGPTSNPTDPERQAAAQLKGAAARGQKLILNLAVTPNADLGSCTLQLADLQGPGTIPAAAIRGYFENHFYNGSNWAGSVLAPTLTLDMDKGITRPFWLWLTAPADAKPGQYKATFTFKPAKGKATDIPVEIEVYPFVLQQDNVPLSCGFWGGIGPVPKYFSAATRKQVVADRLHWMRDIGLTSITVGGVSVQGLNADGTVRLSFDPTMLQAAKDAGMARNPQQALMYENWMASIGRPIAVRIPGSADVETNRGVELKQPEFRGYCLDAAKQYKKFIDGIGVPVVVTAVDEPREFEINSWNRNFDDSVEYLKILRQAGLVASVDPMSDKSGAANKDYAPFVDYVDVMSTHAWELSARMMRLTVARGKTLWLYNVGIDRYSWGFYNWRAYSHGRWEWQLHDGRGTGENNFNPLRAGGGLTQEAPLDLCPGGFALEKRMMAISQGITDYTYLYTLEEALKAYPVGTVAPPVAQEARAFLESLRAAMPEFPQVRGLASVADAARVGMGIEDQARLKCTDWRGKIGDYLKRMGYKAPGDPAQAVVYFGPVLRRAQLIEAVIRGTHLFQMDLAAKSGKGDPKAYGDQGLSQADRDRLLKDYAAILAAAPRDVTQWIAMGGPGFDGEKPVTELTAAKIDLADNLPVSRITQYITGLVGPIDPARIRAIASLYQVVLEVDRDGDALQKLIQIYLAPVPALGMPDLPIYLGELAIDWDDPQFAAMGKELSPLCAASPVGTSPAEWLIASRKLQNWGEHYTGKVTAATYAKRLLEIPSVKDCTAAITAMPAQKVCIIGHSFTMSAHWSSQGSFTDIAAEAIRSINPKVQFISFQGGGLSPTRALRDFADQAVAQKPDVVLLVLTVRSAAQIEDLKKLVAKLKAPGAPGAGGGAKVYMFDSMQAEGQNLVTYGADVTKGAADAGATIIEVRKILELHPLRGDFVALDGIHMNPPYHKVMAAEWVKFLCGKRQAAAGEVVDVAAEPAVKSIKEGAIPKLAALPVMKDGDWAAAAEGLAEFDAGTLDIGGGRRRIGLRTFMGRTDKDLYVLFYSCEPNTAGIATKWTDPKADHDKTIWDDDTVELFLCTDPAKAPRDYYQFIINSAGTFLDGRNKDAAWESGAKVTAKVIPAEFGKPGAWIVELVVPLASMGGAPAGGAAWNANFTRSRRQLVKDWEFTWAPMPGANFHQPDRFKPIKFQ